jgi:hypothetical protein
MASINFQPTRPDKGYASRFMLVITLVGLLAMTNAQAQTFAEWFSQKKTQKKYLLEQLAALKVYSGYLRQGYQVASGGLGSITGYLKNEYGLHGIYYDRLKNPGPEIRGNYMIREIVTRQQDIVTRLRELNKIPGLTPQEGSYLSKVRTTVLTDCDRQLALLQTVISANQVEMQDADRLKLIAKVHAAMGDNYRFATRFVAQTITMAGQRDRERSQTAMEKRIYGIY